MFIYVCFFISIIFGIGSLSSISIWFQWTNVSTMEHAEKLYFQKSTLKMLIKNSKALVKVGLSIQKLFHGWLTLFSDWVSSNMLTTVIREVLSNKSSILSCQLLEFSFLVEPVPLSKDIQLWICLTQCRLEHSSCHSVRRPESADLAPAGCIDLGSTGGLQSIPAQCSQYIGWGLFLGQKQITKCILEQ